MSSEKTAKGSVMKGLIKWQTTSNTVFNKDRSIRQYGAHCLQTGTLCAHIHLLSFYVVNTFSQSKVPYKAPCFLKTSLLPSLPLHKAKGDTILTF